MAHGAGKPRLAISYCTRCQWLLRAAWMAQELLSTFGTELGEVALLPGTGGVPDAKELKRRVRDHLAPGRDLGHIDRQSGP
jgi:selenoprotein W-related protein